MDQLVIQSLSQYISSSVNYYSYWIKFELVHLLGHMSNRLSLSLNYYAHSLTIANRSHITIYIYINVLK